MTNEVVEATTNVACAAQSVADKLTNTVGKQAAEGHAYLKQAMSWLTENGLDFAVNLLDNQPVLVTMLDNVLAHRSTFLPHDGQ